MSASSFTPISSPSTFETPLFKLDMESEATRKILNKNQLIRLKYQTNPSPIFPNLPANPVNGLIKTYDSSKREFSKAYNAKTVYFYKDGDDYFTGIRVPISTAKYKTIDSLMDSLNTNISLPFGVRRIMTPFGKTPISSIADLQHLGRYVATSNKYLKGIDFDIIEKKRRLRQEQMKAQVDSRKFTEQEMFFVLNGHPSRIYRTLIHPNKKGNLNSLLEEISQGLQTAIFKIYTYDGMFKYLCHINLGERIANMEQILQHKESRAIAVPRHERPVLNGQSTQQNSLINENRIDRLSAPKILGKRNSFSTDGNFPAFYRTTNSLNKNGSASSRKKLTFISKSFGNHKRRLVQIKNQHLIQTNELPSTSKNSNSEKSSSSQNNGLIDSDSGRPKSLEEGSYVNDDARIEEESLLESARNFDDEDDYPEVHKEIYEEIKQQQKHSIHGNENISFEQLSRKQSVVSNLADNFSAKSIDLKNSLNSNINEDALIKSLNSNEHAEAQIALQEIMDRNSIKESSTRKTSKNLMEETEEFINKLEIEEGLNTDLDSPRESVKDKNMDVNEAATTIQKNWRGYHTRKIFKATKFHNKIEVINPEGIIEINGIMVSDTDEMLNKEEIMEESKYQVPPLKYEDEELDDDYDNEKIHGTDILEEMALRSPLNPHSNQKIDETKIIRNCKF